MNKPDGTIHNVKEFAAIGDLYDEELKQMAEIIAILTAKYSHLPNTVKNLEKLKDEATTRLHDIGIIAQVDPAPAMFGRPPVIEILGKVRTDPIHKLGFDHAKKSHEVKAAVKRGEDFRGQIERTPKKKK